MHSDRSTRRPTVFRRRLYKGTGKLLHISPRQKGQDAGADLTILGEAGLAGVDGK